MRRVKNRKGRFSLAPDSPVNYSRLYVDVFSVAASLSNPEELFKSAADLNNSSGLCKAAATEKIST